MEEEKVAKEEVESEKRSDGIRLRPSYSARSETKRDRMSLLHVGREGKGSLVTASVTASVTAQLIRQGRKDPD